MSEFLLSEQVLQQHYATLIANLQEAVLVENEDRKIVMVNQAFCDMFGYEIPPHQLKGLDCSRLAEEAAPFFKDPGAFITRINQLLEKQEKVLGDDVELSDGRFFERDFIPVFLENQYKGLMWIYKDITKSKQMISRVVESERHLNKMNRQKDKLFSLIAHDLKAPFNAISSMASLLYKKYDALDDERKKKMIGFINTSADSTFKLLQNLLEWSMSSLDKMRFRPESLNITEILRNAGDEVYLLAEQKNIAVSLPSEQCMLRVDSNMIQTVFRNLLSNAIKYTPEGGKVEVELFSGKKEVEVCFRDTGVGINNDLLEHIRTNQYIDPSAGTEGEKGIGLGLQLCLELVKKHGGSLRASNNQDGGATFTVVLPLK
ncbi:MAG: ATP-binding protein [Bacteroidota bacterium]